MNRVMGVRLCGWCILALTSSPAVASDEFRIFFVPAGEDPLAYPAGPTVIDVTSYRGGTIRLEVFLENTPEHIRGVSVVHPCTAAGGHGGSVTYAPDSGLVDELRNDFIFFGVGGTIYTIIEASACDAPESGPLRVLIARSSGGTFVSEPRYLYEFEMAVSPDAAGTFTLDFFDEGTGALPPGGILLFTIREQLIILADCDPLVGDCNNNGVADGCDIDDGTSEDCNGNGVPDECDMADGTSEDCNGDGVPDECDMADGTSKDCNQNGVPDECDIASGTSRDGNGDGVPDECVFRLFFVRAGDDPWDYPPGPTVLNAAGMQGESLTVQMFLASAPEPIRGAQVVLACSADASAAVAGSIELGPDTALVDDGRDDFFLGCGSVLSAIDRGCNPDLRFVIVSQPVTACSDAMVAPSYVGQVDLTISPDAGGTFVIDFNPGTLASDRTGQPISEVVADPLIVSVGCPPGACDDVSDCVCDEMGECSLAQCVDGQCVYGPKLGGDVNRDGVLDILDLLCVIDGFQSKFDHCTFEDVDIAGCRADGVIDIFDIFAVMDAIIGADLCASTCGHRVTP